MVTTQLETELSKELLNLAEARVGLVANFAKSLDYQKDVDLLVVRLSDAPSSRSKFDYDKNVLFNFDKKGSVVSIEVLDLYDIFSSA
jgi:uncharacterized protein YuzE